MPDIKTKKKIDNVIKQIDKTAIQKAKLKENLINIKNKTNYNNEDISANEYGATKINNTTNAMINKSKTMFDKYGRTAIPTTKRSITNFKNTKDEIQKMKYIQNRAKNIKSIKKKANISTSNTIKPSERIIKTSKNVGKKSTTALKTQQKIGQKAIEQSKKSYQIAKATAKKMAKTIKRAVRATILAVKAIISALKSLLLIIFTGGWIIVIIILIISMIAMIVSSIFGIFFASEDTGSKITINQKQQPTTMSQLISDINTDFINRITQIQQENPCEEYDISSNRAEWKDVLAIYSIRVRSGDKEEEVLTINDEKAQLLRDIFWEMNEISYSVDGDPITSDMSYIEFVMAEPVALHIQVNSKTAEEMADKYNFNEEQRKQLEELRSEQYASMWNAVIYGVSAGSSDIVSVASSQIGNIGGEPYWRWYGFKSRVEWCACFVSWCANECGYIEKGIIPKFAGCQNEGVDWFKACNLWKDRGFSPKERRYYFL